MSRALALLALLAVGCGNATRDCKDATLFVTLTVDDAATAADTLRVVVEVGGMVLKDSLPKAEGLGGTLEVGFPGGYPAGEMLSLRIDALLGNLVLATGALTTTLTRSCAPLALHLASAGEGGVALKVLGEACSGNGDCASVHCVDGVCCDSACSGQCQACDAVDAVGTCTTVQSGAPHGSRSACLGQGSACAGTCDGSSGTDCAYPSIQCRAASCTSAVYTARADCLNGACPAPQTRACTGQCDNGTGQPAASGPICLGDAPVVLKQLGEKCGGNGDCASVFCVDGVCCDSACGGQCQACDVAGKVGTCSTVPSGQPHGVRTACMGQGTGCVGSCNGVSASTCTYPTVACRQQSCANAVLTLAAACLNGACPPAQTQPCNYQCDNGMDQPAATGKSCLIDCGACPMTTECDFDGKCGPIAARCASGRTCINACASAQNSYICQ